MVVVIPITDAITQVATTVVDIAHTTAGRPTTAPPSNERHVRNIGVR